MDFKVFLSIILLLSHSSANAETSDLWMPKVGCHLVGFTREIEIEDCVKFSLTTNACRGFCESFSVSSNFAVGPHRPEQPITSVGQCCNIMESEDVKVQVKCVTGNRELTFRSAKTCSCYQCKKF